jgi:hypothetical protein
MLYSILLLKESIDFRRILNTVQTVDALPHSTANFLEYLTNPEYPITN